MPPVKKREAKRGPGRPIDPNGVRQSGVALSIRCTRDEKRSWDKRAKEEGRALADVVRSLMNEWAQLKKA